MKITMERSILSMVRSETLWGQGLTNGEKFTAKQLEQIESVLEDAYPDGMDIVELNDALAYEVEELSLWTDMTDEEFGEQFGYERELPF